MANRVKMRTFNFQQQNFQDNITCTIHLNIYFSDDL